jgi:hypothetical protein
VRHPVPVWAIVKEALGLYWQEARVLLPVAFLLFLIPAVSNGFGLWHGSRDLFAPGAAARTVAAAVISTTAGTLYAGMVVGLLRELRQGRGAAGPRELMRFARPVLGRLVGAGILAGLAIGAGTVLFFVGLIPMVIWVVIAPVIVVEETGVRPAFKRSWNLVRGHAWSVIGVLLLVGLISAVFLPLFLLIPVGPAKAAVTTVTSTLTAPLSALAVGVLYFHLRIAEDAKATAESPPLEPAAAK